VLIGILHNFFTTVPSPNKGPIDREVQLAWKCLLTSKFFDGWFWCVR